jgi:tryptophan 7-halogenase
MKKKEIIILGGGTAGWLTALYIKKVMPMENVTIISNEKIGIIGVGEATTPNIIKFLNFLEISFLDILKEADGSIKNGISFENWNGDNKKYFHGFYPKNDLFNFQVKNVFTHDSYEYFVKYLINNNLNLNNYIYNNRISYNNKIDLNNIDYALHFCTNKLSVFLKKIANLRNIKHVEGTFKKVILDKDGYVTKVKVDNQTFNCDFIFDCSGFRKEIIQKVYNERWISYKKYLPMKKAIPFYLDVEDKIEPYTKAIAMENGWIWQIPLQSRYGSGYVFDSDYITDDQALEEAEKFFNKKLIINNSIKFEAGRFEKSWVKNCIAIGLSSTFIEPLESTSIFLTVGQLETLSYYLNNLFCKDEKHKQMYNKIISNNMEDTLDFVRLHYVCKRKSSKFWKEFSKNKLTDRLIELLPILKNNKISPHYFQDKLKTAYFGLQGHLYVAEGLCLIEDKNKEDFYSMNLSPNLNSYKNIISYYESLAIDHKSFLKSIAVS